MPPDDGKYLHVLRCWRELWRWGAPLSLGAREERLAARWLRRERGFQLVVRNWRNPQDEREEIDLVGRVGETVVCVEVKARAAGALVPGYYAVNARKRRVLRRAIKAYLAGLRSRPRTFRFDIVEIVGPEPGTLSGPTVLHFENVPLFSKYFRAGE